MTTKTKKLSFEQAWRVQYSWAADALRDARQPKFRYHAAVALEDGRALCDRLAEWQENLTSAIEWIRYLTALYLAVQFVHINEVAPVPENQWSKIQQDHYALFHSGVEYAPETIDRGREIVNEWYGGKTLTGPYHKSLKKLMDAHGKWPYS
jgi:hypothetical protein